MALYREQGLIDLPLQRHPCRTLVGVGSRVLPAQPDRSRHHVPGHHDQAAIPVIEREPALWAAHKDQLYSRAYDARDLPWRKKQSIWIGMGAKRKNKAARTCAPTPRRPPRGAGGRGREYTLRGHSGSSRPHVRCPPGGGQNR